MLVVVGEDLPRPENPTMAMPASSNVARMRPTSAIFKPAPDFFGLGVKGRLGASDDCGSPDLMEPGVSLICPGMVPNWFCGP